MATKFKTTDKAPSVHVTESSGGVRTIQGAGTSVPAFLGKMRPAHGSAKPHLVRNWTEFKAGFPDVSGRGQESTKTADVDTVRQSYLPDAVYGYFANGGGPCYIVEVPLTTGGFTKGLDALKRFSDVTMVLAPDAWLVGGGESEVVAAVQKSVARHCAVMRDRMMLLEAPSSTQANRDDLNAFIGMLNLTGAEKQFSTLYYPWVQAKPVSGGDVRRLPPSGFVAGVWCRSDAERGVHTAPANESVSGVLDLPTLSDAEQDLLDGLNVNSLRVVPGEGPYVRGAMTLSKETHWRYINVRRLVNFLRESIVAGTRWAHFEPNNEELWTGLRQNVTAFLTDQWRAGALIGETAEQAFHVKCDHENNPPAQQKKGIVRCDIGIAPTRPAEFLVFTIKQATA